MKLENLIDELMNMELSVKTQKAYRNAYKHYFDFLEAKGINTPTVSHLSYALILEFKSQMSERFKSSTVRLILRAIIRLARFYFNKTGKRLGAIDIRVPQSNLSEFKGVPQNDLYALLEAINKENPRNRLAISLMLFCGLRISEVVALDYHQLQDGALNSVKGKGTNKDNVFLRTIPLPEKVENILPSFFEWRNKISTSGKLICKDDGTPLGIKSLFVITKRVMESAQCSRTNPHALRHTFARRALELIGQEEQNPAKALTIVSQLLGHTKLETTMIYLRSEINETKRILKKL